MKSMNNPRFESFTKSTDPEYLSQERRFYSYLIKEWYTCRQASEALGITISNCTLYKRTWEKMGLLWTSPKKYRCPITGKSAHRITANLELAQKELPHLNSVIQGSLFQKEVLHG